MVIEKKKSISIVVSKQYVLRRLSTGVWRENRYTYAYTQDTYNYIIVSKSGCNWKS